MHTHPSKTSVQPWQVLFVILWRWIHGHQQQIIEFQNDRLQSLLEALGQKCIRLTDDQRRALFARMNADFRRAKFDDIFWLGWVVFRGNQASLIADLSSSFLAEWQRQPV